MQSTRKAARPVKVHPDTHERLCRFYGPDLRNMDAIIRHLLDAFARSAARPRRAPR